MTEKIDVDLDFGFEEDEEDETTTPEVIPKSQATKDAEHINTSIQNLAAADASGVITTCQVDN